jgi:hypothetical protein
MYFVLDLLGLVLGHSARSFRGGGFMARTTKWPLAQLSDIAAKALELADEHRESLEPRLAAGVLDHLRANVDSLDGARSGATRAQVDAKSATKNQNEAAKAGYALVESVRRAVTRAGAKASEKKAFGVGLRIREGSVPQIVAGLDAVADGAARYPELLPADLEKAAARRAALAGADRDQGAKKGRAKVATAARANVQVSVEGDVDAILAAAEMAFHDDPPTLALFRDLVPSRSKKKKATAPAPA